MSSCVGECHKLLTTGRAVATTGDCLTIIGVGSLTSRIASQGGSREKRGNVELSGPGLARRSEGKEELTAPCPVLAADGATELGNCCERQADWPLLVSMANHDFAVPRLHI